MLVNILFYLKSIPSFNNIVPDLSSNLSSMLISLILSVAYDIPDILLSFDLETISLSDYLETLSSFWFFGKNENFPTISTLEFEVSLAFLFISLLLVSF